MSCRTCQPTPDCTDTFDRYSLQDDVFFFVGNCPPGFGCNSGPVTIICCDGEEFFTNIPPDASQTLRNQIISAMVAACARRQMFCGDGAGGSAGGGGGGGTGTSPDDPIQMF